MKAAESMIERGADRYTHFWHNFKLNYLYVLIHAMYTDRRKCSLLWTAIFSHCIELPTLVYIATSYPSKLAMTMTSASVTHTPLSEMPEAVI